MRLGLQFCVIAGMQLPLLGGDTPASKASGTPQTGTSISTNCWSLLLEQLLKKEKECKRFDMIGEPGEGDRNACGEREREMAF